MAIARVVANTPAPARVTNQSSISLSWPQTTTKGNLLIAVLGINQNATNITVTQAPTGWTSIERVSNASAVALEIFYIPNSDSRSASTPEQFQFSAAADCVLALYEYSGADRWALDVRRSFAASGTIADTQAVASVQADELWFAAVANASTSNAATGSQSNPQNGFSQISQLTTTNGTQKKRVTTGFYEKSVSAVGSAYTRVTLSTSNAYAAQAVTFRAYDVTHIQGPNDDALAWTGLWDTLENQKFPTIARARDGLVSVMDFGAKGDGDLQFTGTDDTQAIRDAVAYVLANGGTVWFPPPKNKSYMVDGTIDLSGTGSVVLSGADGTTTPVSHSRAPGAVLNAIRNESGPVFKVDSSDGINDSRTVFRDIHITNVKTVGIQLRDTAQHVFRNVAINALYGVSGTCVEMTNVFWIWFQECAFVGFDQVTPTVNLFGDVGAPDGGVESCGFVRFDLVTFSGGGVKYVQKPPAVGFGDPGMFEFMHCVLESSRSPMLELDMVAGPQFQEWAFRRLYMQNVQNADPVADLGEKAPPLIRMNMGYFGSLQAATIINAQPGGSGTPGSLPPDLIEVTSGRVIGMQLFNPRLPRRVVDSNGVSVGGVVMSHDDGLDFITTVGGDSPQFTGFFDEGGPIIRLGKGGEEHYRVGLHYDQMRFGPGGSVGGWDTNLYRFTDNVLQTDDQLRAEDGIKTKTTSGPVSDGSFTAAPRNGTIAVDESGSKLWVRVNDTWKSVDLT
ncbi:MAG: hypothetical protein WD004_00645 [Actinomycetota bacterium]